MEVRATAKKVRVQPRKVRIVANEVKGKPASMSAHLLQFHPSKSAQCLRKVLISAIANAVNVHSLPEDGLKIHSIQIDQGPVLKRITQKAMGRGARILKKTAHITVVLEDGFVGGKMKPHGTKAKPRPKFEAPKRAKKTAAPVVEEPIAETTVMEDITASVEETPQVEQMTESSIDGAANPVEETTSEEPATEGEETKS